MPVVSGLVPGALSPVVLQILEAAYVDDKRHCVSLR
jgi:hypothetical protein